jgi:hypothetical protein
MKHLKTFESFNSLNEEIFGLSKGEKIESRKQKLQADIDKYTRAWVSKGALVKPDEETLKKFWADAEADEFRGAVGISKSTKKLAYRNEDSLSYSSSGGHAGMMA